MLAAKLNYNEYKYIVANENLAYVRNVMDSLYGSSDPYPQGVVDSIYYDTLDRRFYDQALNGEAQKRKFRIRGYGDGSFVQLHIKDKDLFSVIKRKQRIARLRVIENEPPDWSAISPDGADDEFRAIQSLAGQYGNLVPAIRVRYRRYRYRVYDYRMTLDTNIEVMGFSNPWDFRLNFAVLPHHVLEIKTVDPRPHLPLLGLIRLPQISFSKFLLGLNLLGTGEISGF